MTEAEEIKLSEVLDEDKLKELVGQYNGLKLKGYAQRYGGTILGAGILIGPPLASFLLDAYPAQAVIIAAGNLGAYTISGLSSDVDHLIQSGEDNVKRGRERADYYRKELRKY